MTARSAMLTVLTAAAMALGQPADLILRNGKIVTMEKSQPAAQAIAMRSGRIVAVGSNREVDRMKGPTTRIIELNGAMAAPGLIEAHGHFTGLGQFKRSLNLRDAKRWEDIVAMVGAAAKEARPGQWIIGRGFHQSKWDSPPQPSVQGFPVHDALSAVSPENPVLLTHASGHASMVNQKAMQVAGITRGTKDPDGGEVLRSADGNPTGLLNETAQGLARRAYSAYLGSRTPAERDSDAREEIRLAAQESLSKGITSFQDAGSSFGTIDLFRKMAAEDALGVRLWVMIRANNDDLAANGAKFPLVDSANHRLTVRAIKRGIDGALGPRGAWLLEPYADLPDRKGLNTEPVEDVSRTAELAMKFGLQLCVHAIGDRGNRETLDLFEREFRKHPVKKDLRWRVEHAQHLSAADVPRFAKLGVIASMQGVHCTSDAPYVLARLGAKRAEEGAYVWRKLLDSGAIIANGTDAPVEDVDPIPSLFASVTRKLPDGTLFFPAQKMTRMEALKSYTIDAAYAAFEENIKGSLKVGKLADVTVLSKDFLTIPDSEIPSMQVLYTIVGGKVAFSKAGAASPGGR